MPPLPFNLGANVVLRRRISAALAVAPVLLALAAVFPCLVLQSWLMASAGMSPDASVRYHPHADIVVPLMGLALASLLLAGYAAGWLVNAIVLFLVGRWRWADVCQTVLRSHLPLSWRRKVTLSQVQEAKLRHEFERWEQERQVGWLKYVGLGLLKLGLPMAALLLFFRWQGRDAQLASTHWATMIAVGVFIGVTVTVLFWSSREHRYLYRNELLDEA
jgi:hypothetical protein